MTEFADSIDIAAPPETVFDYLVTVEGMTAWMGDWARLDPVAGGAFAVDIAGSPIRGAYLEVDRPRSVVVSWGLAGSDELPPGSTRVSFTLTPIEGGTRVDLHHAGLPDPFLAGHTDGWAHFLPRLEVAATTGEPVPADGWLPLARRAS
jgi:uncharacterized protein YndB with AHSA1/START domain